MFSGASVELRVRGRGAGNWDACGDGGRRTGTRAENWGRVRGRRAENRTYAESVRGNPRTPPPHSFHVSVHYKSRRRLRANAPTTTSPAPARARVPGSGVTDTQSASNVHENDCDAWSANPVTLSVVAFVNSTCGIRKLYWIAPFPQVEKYPISP